MKKIPIWKNVTLLVAVLFVIIIATFAWFFTGPKGTAKEMVVHVGRATYIQISGDGGGLWSDDLDLPITLVRRFKEISGNGTALYAPVYGDVETGVGTGVYTKGLLSFKPADSSSYFEHILDFRSDAIQDIYLSPESYVKTWEAMNGDRIDGAIRVAFFELDKDGNETLRYIWAPNSKVEYSAETDSFTEEGSVEPYYYYQRSEKFEDPQGLTSTGVNVAAISTADTDENGCGYNKSYKFLWSNGENLPQDAPAAVTVDEPGKDGLYYKKLKVKIWIEGHDRECVSALSGDKFIVKLEFRTAEGDTYE